MIFEGLVEIVSILPFLFSHFSERLAQEEAPYSLVCVLLHSVGSTL